MTNRPIAPPFNFNAPGVSAFSPEVTGRLILNSMCERVGWPSLASKRLLDFGCGVRFTQTLINLEIPIGRYIGIDTNAEPIEWLKANVSDDRFRFEHVNIRNRFYNREGPLVSDDVLDKLDLGQVDLASMFSVITHQNPEEAALTFRMLRRCAQRLYFTAFTDELIDGYTEKFPETPGLTSTYSPGMLQTILKAAGWEIESRHPLIKFQQPAFVCRHSN